MSSPSSESPYIARMLKAGCSIYQANGYYNRYDYLRCMSEDYDITLSDVKELADRLGEQEDFAGLPKQLDELKSRLIANVRRDQHAATTSPDSPHQIG